MSISRIRLSIGLHLQLVLTARTMMPQCCKMSSPIPSRFGLGIGLHLQQRKRTIMSVSRTRLRVGLHLQHARDRGDPRVIMPQCNLSGATPPRLDSSNRSKPPLRTFYACDRIFNPALL